MSTKTMGIYKITSKKSTELVFVFIGSSTQIEICTKDYLSWCKKGKAPKKIQEEYDRHQPASIEDIFEVTIVKVCNTPEELTAAKLEYGLAAGGSRSRSSVTSTGKKRVSGSIKQVDFYVGDRIQYRGHWHTITKITENNVVMKRDNYKYLTEVPLQHMRKSPLYKRFEQQPTEIV